MTQTQRVERLRLIAGILSAVFGVLGFVFGVGVFTSIAIGCAIIWLGCIFVKANAVINEATKENER